jgi:seryl-tRNA(Sec) selenium transferase
VALSGLFGAGRSAAAPPLSFGKDIYQSIGVRPIVNCKGTFTIIGGSQTVPEVKRAMDDASRHFVHLDELMAAVGKRLAELTQAEWGIVTAGCAAALTHATAASIAGADPEKLQRLPNLAGLKSEVIMPRYSRTPTITLSGCSASRPWRQARSRSLAGHQREDRHDHDPCGPR